MKAQDSCSAVLESFPTALGGFARWSKRTNAINVSDAIVVPIEVRFNCDDSWTWSKTGGADKGEKRREAPVGVPELKKGGYDIPQRTKSKKRKGKKKTAEEGKKGKPLGKAQKVKREKRRERGGTGLLALVWGRVLRFTFLHSA